MDNPSDINHRPGGVAPDLMVCIGGQRVVCRATNGPVFIGRDLAAADIRVNHPRISRLHVRLAPCGESWQLTDCDSLNGTFVHGRRISTAVITDGLVVHLAHRDAVTVTFRCLHSSSTRRPTGHRGGQCNRCGQSPVTDHARVARDDSDDENASGESTDPLTPEVRVALLCDALIIALKMLADGSTQSARNNTARFTAHPSPALIRELEQIEGAVLATAARHTRQQLIDLC